MQQQYDDSAGVSDGQNLPGSYAESEQIRSFWRSMQEEIQQVGSDPAEFKNHQLPLARIKKIMKSDEDVRMISAEAPVLFAKACELFILELTLKAWLHAEDNKRRTLQRSDIAAVVNSTYILDFLQDVIPREGEDPPGGSSTPAGAPSTSGAAAAAAAAAVPDSGAAHQHQPPQPEGQGVVPTAGMGAGTGGPPGMYFPYPPPGMPVGLSQPMDPMAFMAYQQQAAMMAAGMPPAVAQQQMQQQWAVQASAMQGAAAAAAAAAAMQGGGPGAMGGGGSGAPQLPAGDASSQLS